MRHYLITRRERQIKLESDGQFEADTLCGNGNFHADTTRVETQVECPHCLDILSTRPAYLESSQERDWQPYGHVYAREDEDNEDDPVYTVWSDGEIFQITSGRRPLNDAGYGLLNTVLKIKNIEPRRLVEVGESHPKLGM